MCGGSIDNKFIANILLSFLIIRPLSADILIWFQQFSYKYWYKTSHFIAYI